MVRGLVEDDEVRARLNEEREAETPALAARELAHRFRVLVPPGEAPAPEERLCVRADEPRRALDALRDRAALVELAPVLGEVAELDAVADLEVACSDPVEEGGLAGSVGADQRHVLAALEGERHVVQELAAGHAHGLTHELEHQASAAPGLGEREARRAPAARQERVLLDGTGLLPLEA